MLFSKQTPAAGGTAFAQFDAAWCYDGNGYILNDTGTSLDVRIGASGSVQTLASGATLPIKLVYSMAELYVRRTDQSTTQVTVEAQVGTGSAGGGTSAEVGVIAAATAAASTAAHNASAAAHGGNDSFAALRRLLRRATTSQTIVFIGDSTTNERTDVAGRFTDMLAAAYPAWSFALSLWDATNMVWGDPVAVQTGTAGVASLTNNGSGSGSTFLNSAAATPQDADGVQVWTFDITLDWTGSNRVFLQKGSINGNRAYRFMVNSNYLYYSYSKDGTAYTTPVQSSIASLAWAAGSSHIIQLRFDPATSIGDWWHWTAGAWAKIGATSANTGAAGCYNSTANWELVPATAGTVRSATCRLGAAGEHRLPLALSEWSFGSSNAHWSTSGAPVLTILSGGHSGGTFSTWSDDERTTRALSRYKNCPLCVVMLGLNGGYSVGATYFGELDTMHAALKAKTAAGFVYVGVNPKRADADYVPQHNRRLDELPLWCVRNAVDFYDVSNAFNADSRGLANLLADTVHPNADGYTLYAQTLAAPIVA